MGKHAKPKPSLWDRFLIKIGKRRKNYVGAR